MQRHHRLWIAFFEVTSHVMNLLVNDQVHITYLREKEFEHITTCLMPFVYFATKGGSIYCYTLTLIKMKP